MIDIAVETSLLSSSIFDLVFSDILLSKETNKRKISEGNGVLGQPYVTVSESYTLVPPPRVDVPTFIWFEEWKGRIK